MGIASTIARWFGRTPRAVSAQAAVGSAPAPARPAGRGATSPQQEPMARVHTDWNPMLLRNVPRWSDSGDLRLVSDLCDCILADDRVASAFSTRTGGLLGSPLTFETSTASGAIARRRALKAVEAGEDWWHIFPESELRLLLTWGLLLGVAFGQLIWSTEEEHGNRLVPKLRVWHPRWFRWSWDKNTWLRWDTERNEWMPIKGGDGEWIVYTPFGQTRPWAYGLWRGLSAIWMLKVYALRDWGRRSEAHGQPAWIISSETSDDYARRQELTDLFADLGRNPAVGIPRGFTADLVSAPADTAEIFEKQINLAQTGYAVSITGGNLTIEVTGHARTGATAQTLVRIDYKRNDATSLSTMAHEQVLCWWSEWNFADSKAAPWPIWNVEPPADMAALATTWLTVARSLSAFRLAGITVDLSLTAERFNIPITGEFEPPPVQGAPPDEPAADDKAAPDDEAASKDA